MDSQDESEYMYVGDTLVPSYFHITTKKNSSSILYHKNKEYLKMKKMPERKVLIESRMAENTPPLIENNYSHEDIRIMDESIRNSYLISQEPP